MESIVEAKDCLSNSELLDILAESVYNPTPERLKSRAVKYIENPHIRIYAYTKEGSYIGIIVLDIGNSKQTQILDLAVKKGMQKNGIGSKLIGFSARNLKHNIILAETDDDAIGFYRKAGFSIQALGDLYGVGIHRYLCTLAISDDE